MFHVVGLVAAVRLILMRGCLLSETMSDERRRDEIDALESIFTGNEIKRSEEHGPSAGQFYAHITVPEGFSVSYTNQETKAKDELMVSFLPPIVLHYSLPEEYPSNPNFPPSFTLTCHWLTRSQLTELCKRLDSLWKENLIDNQGTEILFTWAQFLKCEVLEFLKIENVIDVTPIMGLYRSKHSFNPCDKQAEVNQSSLQLNNAIGKELETVSKSKISDCSPVKKVWVLKEPSAENSTWTCVQQDVESKELASPQIPVKEKFSTVLRPTRHARKKADVPFSHYTLDCRAVVDLVAKSSLWEYLGSYNDTKKNEEFCRQFHSCNICFETKMGALFTRFIPCDHVFCSECAKSYFTTCISDGKVKNISCPGEKCDSKAQFNQIKDVLDQEIFAKYDRMLLAATLDELGDVISCPRLECQYSVIRDGDDKLATCFHCRYAFCVDCRMGYHGVEPCRFKAEEVQRLVKEYQSASDQHRIELEKRYSKRRLDELVHNSLTQTWMEDNSKSCPHCKASIQKSHGCNKMVCWKCNTAFCWLCCSKLDSSFPYLHFNRVGSKCYNLLFHGIDVNDEELGDEFFEEIDEEFDDEFGAEVQELEDEWFYAELYNQGV